MAKQYARTYAKIGFFSGVIGLMIAVPTIIFISKYAISAGSGLLNGAGLTQLNWIFMMFTPVFSLLFARVTAYYTVRKSLEKMC